MKFMISFVLFLSVSHMEQYSWGISPLVNILRVLMINTHTHTHIFNLVSPQLLVIFLATVLGSYTKDNNEIKL